MYVLVYLSAVFAAALCADINLTTYCDDTIDITRETSFIYNREDLDKKNRSCKIKFTLTPELQKLDQHYELCIQTARFDMNDDLVEVQYGSAWVSEGFYDAMYTHEVRQRTPYCSKFPVFVNLRTNECVRKTCHVNITLTVYPQSATEALKMTTPTPVVVTKPTPKPKTTEAQQPTPPLPPYAAEVGYIALALCVAMLIFVMTPLVIFVVMVRQFSTLQCFRFGTPMPDRVTSVDVSTATTGVMAGQLQMKPAIPVHPYDA